jgi:hypothetical protein
MWMRLEGAGSTARAEASMSSRYSGRERRCGPADLSGDRSDGREVAVGGDGESGLEDIDAKGRDLVG